MKVDYKYGEVGDRVVLTDPHPSYEISEGNPAVGTEFECEGTIIFKSKFIISVSWDNGSSNGYMGGELSLVGENVGSCIDIWKEM